MESVPWRSLCSLATVTLTTGVRLCARPLAELERQLLRDEMFQLRWRSSA